MKDFGPIFSCALDAMLIADDDANYVAVNPAAIELFGFSEEEFLSMRVFDLIPPPPDVDSKVLWQSFVESGEQEGELPLYTKAKDPIWCHYKAVAAFEPGHHLSIIRDISRRKKLEDEAAKNLDTALKDLELQTNAMNACFTGIAIVDATKPDYPLIYVNEGFTSITGYTREEVLGKNCRFLQGKDGHQEGVNQLREAIRDKLPATVEVKNYKKDGTPFWNEIILTPVRSKSGNVTHFIGIQNDVTQRKALQTEMVQASKMASIGLLAAGIGHEINNPLTVVGYVLANLAKDMNDSRIEKAQNVVRRITEISSGLTKFARSQNNSAPQRINLSEVVRETVALVGEVYKKEGFEIEVECDENVWINASFGEIQQVLMNLVSNSRDAYDKGSHRKVIRIRTGSHGNDAFIQVQDFGCGMNDETIEQMFDPFFTTKDVGKGTGLGMGISRTIVDKYFGAFDTQSEVGKGTVMKIKFPVAELTLQKAV